MIECCACRETNVEKPGEYSDHDSLCRLSKYRCNQYECEWCDYCDATQSHISAKSRIALPPSMNRSETNIIRPGWAESVEYEAPARGRTSYKGWNKHTKPRPPKCDALDLPTTDPGYSGDHVLHE